MCIEINEIKSFILEVGYNIFVRYSRNFLSNSTKKKRRSKLKNPEKL